MYSRSSVFRPVAADPPGTRNGLTQKFRALGETIGVVEPHPAWDSPAPRSGPQQRFGLPVLEQAQDRRSVVAPGALGGCCDVPQIVLVGLAEGPGERPGGMPVPLFQRARLRAARAQVDEQRVAERAGRWSRASSARRPPCPGSSRSMRLPSASDTALCAATGSLRGSIRQKWSAADPLASGPALSARQDPGIQAFGRVPRDS